MAQGLQVFDENGRARLFIGRRLTKVIGRMQLNGTGEFDIPSEYKNNKLWYFIISCPMSVSEDELAVIRISADGKKIIWQKIHETGTILYGVY